MEREKRYPIWVTEDDFEILEDILRYPGFTGIGLADRVTTQIGYHRARIAHNARLQGSDTALPLEQSA